MEECHNMLKTIYNPLLKCLYIIHCNLIQIPFYHACAFAQKNYTRTLGIWHFLYCAFTLTHCIEIYANLSRCAYVLTPCTVIIYLICCFASLCLRIFPLHRNICMWCLFIRGYPLHNEPIDGLVSWLNYGNP